MLGREAQKAEELLHRREYDEHSEQFVRMGIKAFDWLFTCVRKNVTARLSSAR